MTASAVLKNGRWHKRAGNVCVEIDERLVSLRQGEFAQRGREVPLEVVADVMCSEEIQRERKLSTRASRRPYWRAWLLSS